MTTVAHKVNLLKGFVTRNLGDTGPIFVTVDVTHRCNLQCVGCRFHSATQGATTRGETVPDLPLPTFERLLSELAEMGTRELILLGEGEPLLHPRIFDMISLATERGTKTTLLTNGTLLNEANCRSLVESGLDILKVSLWAASAEEYQLNHPGTHPRVFNRVVDGLKLLASIKTSEGTGPRVVLHQPITRHNYRGLDAMVELARSCDCDALSFSPLKFQHEDSTSSLSASQSTELCERLEKLQGTLGSLGHNIPQTLLRYRLGKAVWHELPCYVGWYACRVSCNGTVWPCSACDCPTGNLNRSSFRDIWNSDAFYDFRQRTITREGLTEMGEKCDCSYCCFASDNVRAHRALKWLAPFRRKDTVKVHP